MSITALQSDCKRVIESLTHLSNAELDEIMNSDEKLEEILNNLEHVSTNKIVKFFVF